MDVQGLVVDDPVRGIFRLHRSVMTSAEIFALERERIFDKCWLYLGHESEVEQPGDFVRRSVAGRPLFFTRGRDGQVRAFFNTCPHRGARVCRQDSGNTRSFQCFYHSWTFSTEGELIGVPDAEAYACLDRAEFGLQSPARIDQYRRLYFISFSPDVEDLVSYLGEATEYIDLVFDQAELGMRVVPGVHRYTASANWKLLVENSFDGYHAAPIHETYFTFLGSLGDNPSPRWQAEQSKGYALGNGHATSDAPTRYPKPTWWHPLFGEEARADIAAIQERLAERNGNERGERMANTTRNLLIFPNLLLLDVAGLTLRVVWPVAPDRMEVSAWGLAPREETGEQLARRLDNFRLFLSPGGFGMPDDLEAVEACQEGFAAIPQVQWSDMSRGMLREGDRRHTDEAHLRAFWREWHARMRGLPHGDHREGRKRTDAHGTVTTTE